LALGLDAHCCSDIKLMPRIISERADIDYPISDEGANLGVGLLTSRG